MNAKAFLAELRAVASEEKRAVLSRFFKSGPGEYGAGDKFLGVMVPQIRAVAKNHAGASSATEDALLASPWHEARECGLFLMCNRFTRADAAERAAIHARYLVAAAAGRVLNIGEMMKLPSVLPSSFAEAREVEPTLMTKTSGRPASVTISCLTPETFSISD